MSHVHKKQSGFTLIELSLAMAFISALLIAIAMTILQVIGIYSRGITLKEVNQAGRTISSELQDGINSSMPFDITPGSGSYLGQSWGGALCTGSYSYIWNYGDAISSTISSGKNNDNLNIYSASKGVIYKIGMPSSDIPHLIKIYDPSRTYCSKTEDDPIKIDYTKSTDLLAVGQNDLAIHYFSITASSDALESTMGQKLYDISSVIGTNNPSALTDDIGPAKKCLPPSSISADTAYCSIEQFHIVARAGSNN